MFHRPLAAIVVGAALGALGSAAVQAQSFPTRPITLVVPFPAGGTADLLCRFAGEKMSAALGQQVVIENRVGGAGGRVAIEQVMRSPADGYTLLCNTQLSYSITHLVFAKAAFDPRPLEPISVLATYPLIILIKPSLPVNTLAEFNAYAKANKVNYGNQGVANTGHLLGALMELKGGYKMTPVFYRGSAPAINDLLAGTIDMVPDYLLSNNGNIDAGKIKMIELADT
jgi:tripartite-type tricarboxylate transporter receptor subunit TctC